MSQTLFAAETRLADTRLANTRLADTRVFRGNLHGHSTHSDGHQTTAEVVRLYREAGYDFTCLSDHLWSDPRFAAETVNDSSAFDGDAFITIPSAEIHCLGKLYDQDGLWHLVANGLPLDFPVASKTETASALVKRAVDAGAFVTIAHPEWYALTTEEARSLAEAGAHGVEIYNHSSAIGTARGGGIATLDQLANEGFRMHLTATDDSHMIPDDAFGGWVMVAADRLTGDAIIAALKAGHFYSSCGPDFINITVEAGQLHVATSPVSRIVLAGGGHRAWHAQGAGLTSATFDLGMVDAAYVRLVITDAGGNNAWSNVFWMADLT